MPMPRVALWVAGMPDDIKRKKREDDLGVGPPNLHPNKVASEYVLVREVLIDSDMRPDQYRYAGSSLNALVLFEVQFSYTAFSELTKH